MDTLVENLGGEEIFPYLPYRRQRSVLYNVDLNNQ